SEDVVEGPGIELRARALPRTMTVAEQRRVEIRGAIARDASLFIMDEPTSALTADESERLFEVIRALQGRGATIVYVSHFLQEVLSLANTVTVLRDGRLVRTAPAAEETPERLVAGELRPTCHPALPAQNPPP